MKNLPKNANLNKLTNENLNKLIKKIINTEINNSHKIVSHPLRSRDLSRPYY